MPTIVTFLASFLIWMMIFSLVPVWAFGKKGVREGVVHAAFSLLLAWIIADLTKEIFPTPRPFQINGAPALTLTVPLDSSFPSTHTTAAFALGLSAYLHDKKVGIYYLLAAFLVGLGRIVSNAHFLLDVVGGALLGTTISLFVSNLHLAKIAKKLGI